MHMAVVDTIVVCMGSNGVNALKELLANMDVLIKAESVDVKIRSTGCRLAPRRMDQLGNTVREPLCACEGEIEAALEGMMRKKGA